MTDKKASLLSQAPGPAAQIAARASVPEHIRHQARHLLHAADFFNMFPLLGRSYKMVYLMPDKEAKRKSLPAVRLCIHKNMYKIII